MLLACLNDLVKGEHLGFYDTRLQPLQIAQQRWQSLLLFCLFIDVAVLGEYAAA